MTTYKCSECKEEFKGYDELFEHLTHSEAKSYICPRKR